MSEPITYDDKRLKYLQMMVTPVIRYCLRNSHSVQDLVRVVKVAFVQLAVEDLEKKHLKVNQSRISVITGLTRSEVSRISQNEETEAGPSVSVLARVIALWQVDKRFTTKGGRPRALSYRGEPNDLRDLVESVSNHIDAGAVLFELERQEIIERSKESIKLVKFIHRIGHNEAKGFELLSNDIDSLLSAVEQNIRKETDISNLHIRTEYDNIIKEDIPKIKRWLLKEGKAFHRKARAFISKYDRDVNPRAHPDSENEMGAQVVLTAFSAVTADELESKSLSTGGK